jgi:3-oxoacyl-[acyl-carrier-protein] synthase-1
VSAVQISPEAKTRVVITGAGAVCGAGLEIKQIWDALCAGRSAIGQVTQWDTSHWPARLAAEVVGVDNRTLVEDRKVHKITSRTDLLGLYAAGAAIQDSGLGAHRENLSAQATALFNDRSGVYAGSGGGNYLNTYEFYPLLTTAHGDLQAFGRDLSGTVNPMWLLKHLPNNVVCHVGIRHNFKGANACITNQCVGGSLAVLEAVAGIRAGEADRAVAIGHDAPIEPETFLHYHRLGLLSTDTLRPFDVARSGTIFGEGAGAVMLEKAEDAAARQAIVLGEVLGGGCATEAAGIVDVRSDGDGLVRAMRLALAEAGLSPAQVGMIVAHGNGTRASDASEAMAIKRLFGDDPPPVASFKWAFGHLIAASGILDLPLALLALRQGVVPGIATLSRLDPSLPPLPVSAQPQQPRSNVALLLCRGFAAMNVALVVRSLPLNS